MPFAVPWRRACCNRGRMVPCTARSVLAITFRGGFKCYFVAMNRSGSFAFALSVLAAPAWVCAQPAAGYVGGEVMFVSGKAERVQKDGKSSAVAKGMAQLEGDRIR